MSNRLFVLGAKDPEMDRIETLLTNNGETFVHASKDGRRVNPGNAYDADAADDVPSTATLVFVECAIPGAPRDFVIDHHRPGDPGYDMGADQYFEASSIGQLYGLLGIEEVPQFDRVLAATDHCFAAAMQGLCRGVSVAEVRELKEANIAKTLNISPAEVNEMVQYHLENLGERPGRPAYDAVKIGREVVAIVPYTGIGYTLSYLSAQLAATLFCVPVLITLRTEFENEPLRYHLCGDAAPDTIREFMTTWAPEHDLERIYGVPDRGYAGGYEKQ